MPRHSPTIKQLEALYWTAHLGSFQTAADKLCTTQSAIAKRVSELETLFDIRLLDRKSKQSGLTAAGQQFLKHAEAVLCATSRLLHAMADASDFRGTVRIATVDMFVASWLTELIDYLHCQYPQAQIGLEIDSGQKNIEKLKQGHVDIAFSPTPSNDAVHQQAEIGTTEFAWLASPKLQVKRSRLTLADFAQLPRITHSSQHLLLPTMSLSHLGSADSYSITANTFSMLVQLTLSGHGVCYLPTAYLRREIERGHLVKLDVDEMPNLLNFYAVYRADIPHPLVQQIVMQARHCFTRYQAAERSSVAELHREVSECLSESLPA